MTSASPSPAASKDIKRRALGKGIESLLPGRPADPSAGKKEAAPETVADTSGKPRELPVELIDRNPYQTRTNFDADKLAELSESIKASGVVQPILVRPIADRFQLIAGERRWLASKLAGLATIPAILRQVSDEQAMEMTIVENLQRSDLNPMEQARAFERLGREFHMTQERIAVRTGKDRASIGNFLRLLRLPDELQNRVETGELTFGHARALLALENREDILGAGQKVCALAMSVRQTESYVQGLLHPESKAKEQKSDDPTDPNVRDARDRIQRALGLRVKIEDKNGRGRVIIQYSRLEDFDSLLEALLGSEN